MPFPISTRESRAGYGALVRGIGFFGAVLIVLNSVIGAGIFALPAAIAERAGAWSPWLFLACGLLVTTVVLTYSELASYFRESGGPVLYTTSAFGPLTGFTTGWLFFLSRMTAFAANANVLATYLVSLLPALDGGLARSLTIIITCTILTVTNYIGLKAGLRTIGLLTVFKILPLLLLILLGLPRVTSDTLLPVALPEIEDLGGTTLLLIYAFVGFEAGTITAGETSQPRRNLPRALLATVIGTGALYFLIVLVCIAVLPNAGEQGLTLVNVARELVGPIGAIAITATAVCSIGGNLASTMLTVPRLTFALSEQRLLPQWFARVHHRFRTPGNSILFLGALSLAFALSGSFVLLAAASSVTRLLVYVLCIGALPVIRRNADAEMKARAFHLRGGYLIPTIALGLCIWIAMQSTLYSLQVTGSLLAAGLILYGFARVPKRKARAVERV